MQLWSTVYFYLINEGSIYMKKYWYITSNVAHKKPWLNFH